MAGVAKPAAIKPTGVLVNSSRRTYEARGPDGAVCSLPPGGSIRGSDIPDFALAADSALRIGMTRGEIREVGAAA